MVDGSIKEGEARARLVFFPPSRRLPSPPASCHFSILAKERTEVQENELALSLGRLRDPKIYRTGDVSVVKMEQRARGCSKKQPCYL